MLVELRVAEQRYRAVWEVLEGASVTEISTDVGRIHRGTDPSGEYQARLPPTS